MVGKTASGKWKVFLILIILIIIIGVPTFLYLSGRTEAAFLVVESGKVDVHRGNGWQPATNGMKLSLGDSVRTADGRAAVILQGSIFIQLDENTEVKISELSRQNVKVSQESGATWNKFTSMFGVNTFEVKTPTTVATVRGTEFRVRMDGVAVSEGRVDVFSKGQTVNVNAGQIANTAGDSPTVGSWDGYKDEAIRQKLRTIALLRNLRQKELQKHMIAYATIKKMQGWTDADVQKYIGELDQGIHDEDALRNRAKVPASSMDDFVKLTKQIKILLKEIDELEGGDASEAATEYITVTDSAADNLVAVDCPAGAVIISGGCRGVGDEGILASTIVGNSWLCLFEPKSDPGKKTASAVCSERPSGYETVSYSASEDWVSADCPDGKTLLGGGCRGAGGDAIVVSGPQDNTWVCRFQPRTDPLGKTASAICAWRPVGYETVSYSGSDNRVSVDCPDGKTLVGGGCHGVGGDSLLAAGPQATAWACRFAPRESPLEKTARALCAV
ncbi:FecR domain-containing protein [Nanoarchaeota archaeon]